MNLAAIFFPDEKLAGRNIFLCNFGIFVIMYSDN